MKGVCGDCEHFVPPTDEAKAKAAELSKQQDKEIVAQGHCGRYPPAPVPHVAQMTPVREFRVVGKNRLEPEATGFVVRVTSWGSAVPTVPETHRACGEFRTKEGEEN